MLTKVNAGENAVALIKFFSKKEHYLRFLAGNSLFRTPHYYRTKEDISGRDTGESCFGFWDISGGEKIPQIFVGGEELNLKDAKSLLVYPTRENMDSWMQSWSVIGPNNGFEKSLARMIEEFGSFFVVLPAYNIITYAKLIETSSGCTVKTALVDYSEDRLEWCSVVKNIELSYQKEYRFFLGECCKHELYDKSLQLDGASDLLLNARTLKLESETGDTYYASLGHNKVIKVSK